MLESVLSRIDVEAVSTRFATYLPNLVAAILLAAFFWLLGTAMRRGIEAALRKRNVTEAARCLVLRFTRYAIVSVTVLAVADQLQINITSLIAGIGVAGLALSFAAQDTIANIISGIALVIDRPFSTGDWIRVGDMHASVTDIRMRTTVLTTFDNETVVVPNKFLAQERIVNYTMTPRIRIRVPIGIAFKEDIQSARDVMLTTLEGDERVHPEPAPVVIVSGLAASSVNLELRFWTTDANMKFPLTWEYTEKCKRALDQADIQIPFPHMQMFLETTEGVKLLAGAGRKDRG